ncbi:MAG: phenylalanine--tRNA ligase subunit beta [Kiritimatiellae bacterium]|nr:phenylalanine--tRNA ligase subunit beta [Kiritimatiellia bacterium]
MKLPLSWLNEYIDVSDIAPADLAERLTRSGLQVEAIETVGAEPLSDSFVVGEVLTCEVIEGTHLHKTTVTDGTETVQVVCGAPNCRAGLKSVLAKIGAVVPEGGFKIKKGKLRGVESLGMLCSSRELALPGGTHEGIIELPADTKVGALARDVLGGEKPETVFEIEVTWNRPDALSVIGLAREFSAVLKRPMKMPAVDFVESDTDVNDEVKVVVEDSVRCPRYTARVITSVKDGPSPDFMRRRLEASGVRSLGLLVDVTNYVMLELGQPMHAFDYRTLAGRTIVVRDAKPGETMKTLDGVERKFTPDMLLICDAEKASAVAGVMGGEQSEIAAGTDHVLLESALFDPASTKDTATALDLSTEAAYRYIRGVDKDLADFASRRAAHLLQKYGAAVVAKGVVDVDNRVQPLNGDVSLDFERARKLIGIPVGNDAMVYLLESLGLVCREKGPYAAKASVIFGIPSWRWDLTLEADLVEEIARLYGLDNIPDTMPSAPSVSSLSDAPFRAKNKVRATCLALGFTEAMHYSFLSQGGLGACDARTTGTRLARPDPVSAEYGVLRDSLMPQLYGSLGRNASHQIEAAKLFELGRVFGRDANGRPCESEKLSLGFFGPVGRDALDRRRAVTAEEALLWMKGALLQLTQRLHVGKLMFRPLADHPAFEAALELVVNGRPAGVCGVVSQKLRHPFRLTTQMALAEIDVAAIVQRVDAAGKAQAVPAFPMVRRDFSFVAGPEVTHEAVEKCIRKAAPKELVAIDLFDIYSSKELGKGRRSFAYKLAFRAPDRTLTDDEVNRAFAKVLDALRTQIKVEVRDS